MTSPDAAVRDLAVRDLAVRDLDTSMVVAAGAGTGKTTVLVDRLVALVRSGRGRMGEVAAITFTEAAASELRQRVRSSLEGASAADPADRNAQLALEEADDAVVSTLHSFAERLLLEQGTAVGVAPGFEVLDETADVCDFDARWRRFADALFCDRAAERALVRGFLTGLRHSDLRQVAWALHLDWDRVADSTASVDPFDEEAWPDVDASQVVAQLELAVSRAGSCTREDDNLLAHLREVADPAAQALRAAAGDEEALLQVLAGLPLLRSGLGRLENWGGEIGLVRDACAEAEARRTRLLEEVRRAVLHRIVPRLCRFVLEAAEDRRARGTLNFHDLLVWARALLRDGGEPVESLRRRYRWILVDEFQDTDPIQAELAAHLTADGAYGHSAGAALAHTRPGSLFVVGDPEQSIYRFRRADVALFERVSREIGVEVVLRTNFRAVPGILEFVNAVFAELFGTSSRDGQAGQAPHHALVAGRDRRVEQLRLVDAGATRDEEVPTRSDQAARPAPAVVVLGGAMPAASLPEVRRRAAADVVDCVRRVVAERWEVTRKVAGGREARRAARFSDVALLLPTRTSLPILEDALEEADVPYRLEGSSMLWGTEEVADVLAVLGAAQDPTDEVSVLAALRSPGLACGDDDLVRWRLGGGSWDPLAAAPAELEDGPVAAALRYLARLHEARWWCDPSELVTRVCRELHAYELAFAHRRPRDHFQRLEWLRDQARLFDESSGGSLHDFLSWARVNSQSDTAFTGAGTADPDDDAVRVMTVHGSKGLEFPVVFVCGLERQDSEVHRFPNVVWSEHDELEVRAAPFFETEGYGDAERREQQLDAFERLRLLYVATTRARDHLVLSLHHRERNGSGSGSLAAALSEACARHPLLVRRLPGGDTPAPRPARYLGLEGAEGNAGVEWAAFRDRFAAARRATAAKSGERPVVSATALSQRLAGASEAASAGREARPGYLSRADALATGRAVHAVLASVDLASNADAAGRDVEEVALACARAQGVERLAPVVARMAGSALESETVRRAASRRHWREIYVGTEMDASAPGPSEPVLVEGVIDLLFEDEGGLVVVDYKTDRAFATDRDSDRENVSEAEQASQTRAARDVRGPVRVPEAHVLQLGAYAAAIERSTGRRVSRGVLVFAADTPARERVLEGDELASALQRVAGSLSLPLPR